MKTKKQRDMAASYWISRLRAELDPNRKIPTDEKPRSWQHPRSDDFTVVSLHIIEGNDYWYLVAFRGRHSYFDIRRILSEDELKESPTIVIHYKRGVHEINAILELEIQEALVHQAAQDTEEKNR